MNPLFPVSLHSFCKFISSPVAAQICSSSSSYYVDCHQITGGQSPCNIYGFSSGAQIVYPNYSLYLTMIFEQDTLHVQISHSKSCTCVLAMCTAFISCPWESMSILCSLLSDISLGWSPTTGCSLHLCCHRNAGTYI